MTAKHLSVIDADGESIQLPLDPEWYGTDEQKEQIREKVLDRNMAEIREMVAEKNPGEDIEPNRDLESDLMDRYSICSYDDDNISVRFAPGTWDFQKANEMYNLAQYGMDPSVSFSCMSYGEMTKVDMRGTALINTDGEVYQETDEPDWAKEPMDEDVITLDDDQAFVDALVSLSESDQQMGRQDIVLMQMKDFSPDNYQEKSAGYISYGFLIYQTGCD